MNEKETAEKFLSVTELNGRVARLLKDDPALSDVVVEGEISNFKKHGNGHFYFTLKDGQSSLRAVMFGASRRNFDFPVEDGRVVRAAGRVEVYIRDGSYQLYVSGLEPGGVGALYLEFERLKGVLAAEGLFAPERKKPVPKFPKSIGVVTSATGAAFRDICNIVGRRCPSAVIKIAPALVQGQGAAASVVAGIRLCEKSGADVIIVGRGGGSFEYLNAFNHESVARAIAACGVPVISAVGHETDVTISDFAADLRAPTPSAAAELAVPDTARLLRGAEDELSGMRSRLLQRFSQTERRLDELHREIYGKTPGIRLANMETGLKQVAWRIKNTITRRIEDEWTRVNAASQRIDALSPLKVLARGYSYVTLADSGKTVTEARGLKIGDEVKIRFSEDMINATITGDPIKVEC